MNRWLELRRRPNQAGQTGPSLGNVCPPPPSGNVPVTSGVHGTQLTVVGHGMGPGLGTLKVGTKTATVVSWTDTAVTFTVPVQDAYPTTSIITLTTAGGGVATLTPFTTSS